MNEFEPTMSASLKRAHDKKAYDKARRDVRKLQKVVGYWVDQNWRASREPGSEMARHLDDMQRARKMLLDAICTLVPADMPLADDMADEYL